jgi:hypothetical protein
MFSGKISHVHQREKARLSGQLSPNQRLPEDVTQPLISPLDVLPHRAGAQGSQQHPAVKTVLVHSMSRTLSLNVLSRMKDWKLTGEYVFTEGEYVLAIKISSVVQKFHGSNNDHFELVGGRLNGNVTIG